MVTHIAVIVLVFGFIFAIVLQAWFVRRTARLATSLQDRRETHKQLSQDVAQLSEEVGGFSSGIDANTVSIAGLEREVEALQERLSAFAAEHGLDVKKVSKQPAAEVVQPAQ